MRHGFRVSHYVIYPKLCADSGMEWDSLREKLGHADLKTTQKYVDMEVDLSKRRRGWAVSL